VPASLGDDLAMAEPDAVTLYFHGLPGSAAELAAFGPSIEQGTRRFHVVERTNALTRDAKGDYFGALAEQVERTFPRQRLVLVGFSLGAAAALRVAPHLGQSVRRIDLVSPAGPLCLGNFLPRMAGAPVFRAALAGRMPLAMLSWLQAQVVRLAPEKMGGALMAKAQGGDRQLAANPLFMAQLAQSLRYSLLAHRDAYLREVSLYVSDWSEILGQVTQPVRIWQGDEDDWTPPAMAQSLALGLPNCVGLTSLPGLSHFSTLRHYLASMPGVSK